MIKALTKTKSFKVFSEPILVSNPISTAVLGICSALAVTTQMIPALVMMLAMTFVLAFSNVVISMLRHVIPKNIRIIVELTVIASLVTLADQFLTAFNKGRNRVFLTYQHLYFPFPVDQVFELLSL